MTKFEWYEVETYGSDRKSWQLHLVKPDAHGVMYSVAVIGTLDKLNRAWRVSERKIYVKPDQYWLDKHLTLDEAQRAAKLFLCVGRQA